MTSPRPPLAAARRVNGVAPRPKAEFEVGVSSHLPWTSPYRDAWEVLREEDISVRQLAAMRRTDGQARALYRLVTLPVRAALKTATFVPEDNVEGGEEEAAFVEQMLTLPSCGGGMTVPLGRIVAQMLLAIFDGFSAFEMIYWQPKTGPLKGKWTLKKLAHRPSDTLTFLLNDNSEFAGLRQQTMYQNRQIDVVIPAEHAVYYAANEEERPFYGESYFRAAFEHWRSKFKLYVIAHLAAQRAAVGTRVGTLPPNPSKEDKAEFRKALADLGVAQYMTIPSDFRVDSLKEFTGFDFLAYINHHNSQMSKSVLAAFFDKEQGGGDAGKLVDFGTQSDALFMLMLSTIMGEIEEVINQKVIPRFVDWNFNSGKYPRFQFGSLSEEQRATLLDLFKTIAVAGQSLAIRPEFVHELEKQASEELGLEMDWDTIEAKMEQEAEQQALAEQMQAMPVDPDADPDAPTASPGMPVPGDILPVGGTAIDPQLVPEGFVLSGTLGDDDELSLTELAADLLDEALVELVRGSPNSGGPKFVRTAEGARTYGVPIGTPITRDMDRKLGAHGQKGAAYGAARIKDPHGRKRRPGTSSQQLGGGTGAKAQTPNKQYGGGTGAKPQDPGNVVTDPHAAAPAAQRILTNPRQPGAVLIDYGDGTVALRDPQGRLTPRQRFNVELFIKFGWKLDSAHLTERETAPTKSTRTTKKKPTSR
jgi:hypothetical protein